EGHRRPAAVALRLAQLAVGVAAGSDRLGVGSGRRLSPWRGAGDSEEEKDGRKQQCCCRDEQLSARSPPCGCQRSWLSLLPRRLMVEWVTTLSRTDWQAMQVRTPGSASRRFF